MNLIRVSCLRCGRSELCSVSLRTKTEIERPSVELDAIKFLLCSAYAVFAGRSAMPLFGDAPPFLKS